MNDYKPNSRRSKSEEQNQTPEKKRVEKVIKGTAKPQKKNGLSKFADIFTPGDVDDIKSYIFMDVLVPTIKKAFSEIVTNGVDMILWGGESGKPRTRSGANHVSYRNYYDNADNRRDSPRRTNSRFDFDNLVLDTRGEAEDILDRMHELIEEYGDASVADLYDLANVTGEHTYNKYGWTNLRNAEIIRVRDGYLLKMPKAKPLD